MSKWFLVLILACTLCAVTGKTAGQQIYKWVDEKGTVHFSETPPSDSLKPQGKQNPKERTLEVVTGVEKTREPSKEEVLTDYLKKRDRELDAREDARRSEQERMLKTAKDHQEEMRLEMQLRRDREADRLDPHRETPSRYDEGPTANATRCGNAPLRG